MKRSYPMHCLFLLNVGDVKGTRDNFKIYVNFITPTFLCRLKQDEAYDKK